MKRLVSRLGFEPRTPALKGQCSTVELPARLSITRRHRLRSLSGRVIPHPTRNPAESLLTKLHHSAPSRKPPSGGHGSVKVPGVAYLQRLDISPTKGPLTHRLAVPPLPLGEGCDFDFYPSPLGRGGTARRWVRGLFHRPSDFDGTLGRQGEAAVLYPNLATSSSR